MNPAIARTWAERAQAELGAASRFRDLNTRMKQLNTHPTIIELVERAEKEEEQHAFWCAKMAVQLGHPSGFETLPSASSSFNPSWNVLPERERLLLDVVLLCCITESMNASLLNTLYSRSKQNQAGQLLHQILKDEVKHAQIGWAYLGEASKIHNCAFVSKHLVEMANFAIQEELFLPVSTPLSDAAYQHGVMPEHARREQFKTTLEEVVCAGLEHFDIDTTALKQWAKAFEGSRTDE